MRYLLDTNVLSEVAKPRPADAVMQWLSNLPPLDHFISVLTLGEIATGIERLPPSDARRVQLGQWLQGAVTQQFAGRVLPIDMATALLWGSLDAKGRSLGRPLPAMDGLILATAGANGLVLATRNVSECAGRGVPVFDPWSGELHP